MRMTTNANRRVTDEQIERARSIDLVQFLQQYEPPGELKRIGQSWTLKSHDSMRISADGRWNWFSQNKGGGDAIGFLQAVHGMSFQDAVRTLAGEDFKTIPATQAEHKAKPPERTAFALPPKNNGNRRVFAYLHRSRGIAAEIVNHCIKYDLLYEDAQHHNAVFVGKDENNNARYRSATLRSAVRRRVCCGLELSIITCIFAVSNVIFAGITSMRSYLVC